MSQMSADETATPALPETQNERQVEVQNNVIKEDHQDSSTASLNNSNNAGTMDEISIDDGPPPLHTPHKKRVLILNIGLIAATLDLCILPIVYYYALHFGTNLSLQLVFAVITGVYGLLSFTHYSFRTFKLFFNRWSGEFGPIGWTRWRMLEFLQLNIAIVITLVEVELVAGTAPTDPILRLCAMPGATICFWLGFVFLSTAFLTQFRYRLPFNLSSTPKGSLWRPALFAIIEDAGAIEGRGGLRYREAIMKRYEASPLFRRMILRLSWLWGVGFLVTGIVCTVLIMTLHEEVAFGVGWGLPYAWAAVYVLATIVFVKRSLREEKRLWRSTFRGNSMERGLP